MIRTLSALPVQTWSVALLIIAIVSGSSGTPHAANDDDSLLLKRAQGLFKPLPKDFGTSEAPITDARVLLGRTLYFDPRLTLNANLSCASCHQPALYGTDALRCSGLGMSQVACLLNTPSPLNVASAAAVTWTGLRKSVEEHAIPAMTHPIGAGLTAEQVVDRIKQIPGYLPMFEAAFPNEKEPISVTNGGRAIGAWERTLVTPSPFDSYLAGNVEALRPAARAGLKEFIEVGCANCHDGVGVEGGKFAKFGVVEDYWKATGSTKIHNGRATVTNDPADTYVFRVPLLRNVTQTAPYFHDGSVTMLHDAVQVEARVQLGVMLGKDDMRSILAFLDSITGSLPTEFITIPALPPGTVAVSQ